MCVLDAVHGEQQEIGMTLDKVSFFVYRLPISNVQICGQIVVVA